MNKFQIRKWGVGLTIFCLALLFGATALAHGDPECPPGPDSLGGFARANPPDIERHISDVLDKLVKEGTLTKTQATQLLSFWKEKDREHREEMDKIQAMSPEDRQAYRQQKFSTPPDIIAELKAAATLSDEQAKIVADALRPPHRPAPEGTPHCDCSMPR